MATIEDALHQALDLQQQGANERDERKLAKAQDILIGLLNDSPDNAQVLFQLGTSYLQQGISGLAINLLKRALVANAMAPEVWNNLGGAYKAEQRNKEARYCYEVALKLREHPDYYNNMATLHVNEGEPEKGIELAKKALKLNPQLAKAAWNLSLMELEMGDWENGFRHYLAGIDSGDRMIKTYQRVNNDTGEAEMIPFWDGEKGKGVVVYGEQGLGDEIMFASCLRELAADCRNVIVDCHPRLINLFKRSFGDIENIEAFYPDRKSQETRWDHPHQIDYALPMGNLFYHYRQQGNFPCETYLTPDPVRVKMYRDYFESMGDGPYVGIAWHGGTKRTHANHRNCKLGHLLPIMEQEGTFVSLQYTDVKDKVARFNKDNGNPLLHDQAILQQYDYDETAAYVAALDLVICVNTTIVHLCGAMGQECWTMTPYARAWRYSRYPQEQMYAYGDHVTILNKDKDEPWDSFIRKVADRYGKWLTSR